MAPENAAQNQEFECPSTLSDWGSAVTGDSGPERGNPC